MATVAITILKHHLKKDGTWNVKIRVSHKETYTYIDTVHFVSKSQLDKKGKLKDNFIIDRINPTLKKYRDAISDMRNLDFMTAKEIREKLEGNITTEEVEFIKFCRDHIKKLNAAGKESSAKTLVTVVNNLLDYIGGPDILISEITAKFLFGFETYLKRPRKIVRNGVTYDKKGTGLTNQMRDLRLLFNAARDHFNDEDKGILIITHYPFKKYKIGQAPETESRKLTVKQVRAIRDTECEPGSRKELARDLFMLSLYLCGMNAADLYNLKTGEVDRVSYNRMKTKDRRKDKAFISIKLIPEAKDLYNKYAGNLQHRYATHTGLDTAINKGLKQIDPTLDFYCARYCVGDWARNICGFSKDDVGLTLNHKDRTNETTDIYLSKDWSIIDKVQAALVRLLDQQECKIVSISAS